jgi:hypothetical protein
VHLDLVDRRDDRGVLEQSGQVVDHEVADTDRAHLAVGEQGLQCAEGLERAVEGRRKGMVQDQQVYLLDAELAGALVEGMQRLVVPVVADPDLRLQEDPQRGSSEARTASPTCRSLAYAAPVSMCR